MMNEAWSLAESYPLRAAARQEIEQLALQNLQYKELLDMEARWRGAGEIGESASIPCRFLRQRIHAGLAAAASVPDSQS